MSGFADRWMKTLELATEITDHLLPPLRRSNWSHKEIIIIIIIIDVVVIAIIVIVVVVFIVIFSRQNNVVSSLSFR